MTAPVPPLQYQGITLEDKALPALPAVLNAIMALLDSGKASVVKISELLTKDQALSANILRTINSPIYGFPGRVGTIQNAVALLGFKVVHTIAISQVATQNLAQGMKPLWLHSYASSQAAVHIARILGLNCVSEAEVAGLLHDLFLYDWHTHARETGNHFHGFTHPRIAAHNAEKYFNISREEKKMIARHMWPLTPIPPMSREGMVLTYADKVCSASEVVARVRHWLPA